MNKEVPYALIKEHYNNITPFILERYERRPASWVTPYCHGIRWESIFSPIEEMTWQAIRGFGMCPMFPQYPVGKRFVDFGHPGAKIAIECDGFEFHQDKAKDLVRDKELLKLGWSTFRIPGKDCWRKVRQDYYDIDYQMPWERGNAIENFYFTTIEGLLKALAITYFDYKTYYDDEYTNELELVERCIDMRLSNASPRRKDNLRRLN